MFRAPDFGRVHEALLLLLSTTRFNFGSSLNLYKQTNKQTNKTQNRVAHQQARNIQVWSHLNL
jgi:hypothetical protein